MISAPACDPAEVRVAVEPHELVDLRWERLFGDSRPVELEIGTGKAGFLLNRALHRPDLGLLGIERANEFYKFAVDRMRRRGVRNVRLLRADASEFVRKSCPRDSLDALHVYHPDPWPKRRHHRRRLFQPEFVSAAIACLRPGGRWAVQTDHAEYFEQIRELLAGHAELQPIEFEDPEYGVAGDRVGTNFEAKYVAEGRAIYRFAAQRRG
jgi:tRNA (guanine-N7-)-methyltransferase